ncbi:unnamed protein product, partial [Mesorhabditis belari]|uniref:Nephrin n=1 Tax=Mesorhabditis belari TaxID=2138241 RepID=A0AAF3ENK8_9BILA
MIRYFILFLFLSAGLRAQGLREKPTNLTVFIGKEALLKCAADISSNNVELYSQWRTNTGDLLGYHEAGALSGHQGRYSYVKNTPEELHLKIERVSLDDDGQFECQMLGLDSGPLRAAAHLNVIVPPSEVLFTNYQASSEIEINEETPLNITCMALHSKPIAELKWYINGRQIEDNVQKWETYHLNKTVTAYAALLWKPRRSDHKKMLACEAVHVDTSTQIRANVTLSVLYPSDRPRVKILGGESYVKAADNVTLQCQVHGGNPPPNVTWYLEGRSIDGSFHYNYDTQETSNSYSFIAEASDNMASYECRSQNRDHVAALKTSIHVKVAFAPQAVDIFGESNIRQGGQTTIQCRSRASNPPAKISWFVNGHPVPGQLQSEHKQAHGTISISNLTINSLEMMHSKYKISIECSARNEEGSANKQHTVKILVPPEMPRITGLDDGVLLEGDVVNATCEVRGGHPLADIAWYRGHDKKLIKSKKKPKWSQLIGARTSVSGDTVISSLPLTLDRTLHKQRIRCEATNAALDEPLVDWKQLTIFFTPRRLAIRTPEGARHQIIAGQEARLLCSAPASNPPAEITWHFHPNGEPQPLIYTGETVVNETLREHGHTIENIVSFVPTEQFDGTIVRCIASNSLWPESKNVTFPLNVYYPPRMVVGDRMSIVVAEGDSFRENLTVKANPPVSSWKWKKNGIIFEHTIGSVFARGAALSGRNIQASDAGHYTLYAINSVGTTNLSIHLTVEYPAKIVHITSPVIASAGEEVLLECEVEGVPPTKDMVAWMKNGHEIQSTKRGDSRAVLKVNASLDTAGQYVCQGFNGLGNPAQAAAYLLVNQRPTIIRTPTFSRAAGPLGGKARARCRAHAVPDAEFYWEKNGELIRVNGSRYSFHTTQLDFSTFESTLWVTIGGAEDYGEVKCICSNRLGEDSHSIMIGPLTAPDQPSEPHLTNASAQSLAISWQPGFDGGSDQTFEIAYKMQGNDDVTAVNTTHNHVRISGLQPGRLYHFQVRSHNTRGFSSEYTRPPVAFATLTQDGADIGHSRIREGQLPKSFIAAAVSFIVFCLLCNLLICVYRKNQKRRKMIQEKTEMIRTHGDAAVRPVQMYGAIGADGVKEYIVGPGNRATAGSRGELTRDHSEDDHSIRTMIEVNPNGYMQQIDPAYYERNHLMEYEFDPYQSTRDFSNNIGSLRAKGESYSNVPYPEPPQPANYHMGSLSRRNQGQSINPSNNNNTSPQHPPLSTFIQQSGIRWKRQAIPSTHVQVHSLNSNVSVTSAVRVVSAESRIDLKETFLNASIWSNSSELLFDNFDTYVNYTALNVEDIFHIQSAIIHKQANKTQFSMVTNRTQDGQTSFNEKLEGSVSLRVNDSNMGVQALDGALALINGKTRKENVEKKINVLSAVDKNDNMRKLLIIAESNVFEVKIILNSAEVQIEYGPSVIQIDRSYKHMMIFTNKRNISLDTTNSPFEVSMTENQLLVNCKDDRTVATLSPNSTDVGISVGQYSKLEVDRGKGVMSVGSDSTIAERVNVTSMHLQLNLEGNVIRANSNRSHIDMMGNLTKVGLTAAVHNLTVAGGIPRMILDTGNITVKVLAVEERAVLPSIVPPFVMPKDNYDSLGPVQNESSNTGANNEESDTGTKQAEEPQALTTVIPANGEFITKATEQSVQGVTEVEETTTEQDTTSSSLSTQPSPLNDPFDSITTSKQTTATEIGENESPSVMWTDLTPKTDPNGEEHNTHLTTQPGIPMVGPGEETTVVSETPRNEGSFSPHNLSSSTLSTSSFSPISTTDIEWIAVSESFPFPSSLGPLGDGDVSVTVVRDSTPLPPVTSSSGSSEWKENELITDTFPTPKALITNKSELDATIATDFPTPATIDVRSYSAPTAPTDFPIPENLGDGILENFPTPSQMNQSTMEAEFPKAETLP